MYYEQYLDFVKVFSGKNGATYYVHVKFSEVENPSDEDMVDYPSKYMGMYTGPSQTPPVEAASYTWIKVQGDDGKDGQTVQGLPGKDGQNVYFHVKFSDDGGRTFTADEGNVPGLWIGFYSDQNPDPVLIESFYTWVKVKGEDGIGYTVALSNENHTFSARSDGIVQPESIEIQVKAWENTEMIAATVVIPEDIPEGMNITIKDKTNGTLAPIIVVAVTERFVTPSGTIEFMITCNGIDFTKAFSYSISCDGVGVSAMHNYYLASELDSDVTKDTPGWSETLQEPSEQKRYLWNYEEINYTSGSIVSTDPHIIGVYGETGNGITELIEYYAVSADKNEPDDSEFSPNTAPEMTPTKRYLWNYEKITYTDGSSAITPKHIIGVYGEQGVSSYTHIRYSVNADGTDFVEDPTDETIYIGVYSGTSQTAPTKKEDYTWSRYTGLNGNGINTITYYYAVNSSPTPPSPSDVIGTSLDSVVASMSPTNKYLWQKEVIDFTDSKVEDKTTVILLAVYGNTGEGVTIQSTSVTYQKSNSGTLKPTGQWQDTVPELASGEYLWTKTVVNYSDGTSTEAYSVSYKGMNGAKGDKGDPGVNGTNGRVFGIDVSTPFILAPFIHKDNGFKPDTVTFTPYYRDGTSEIKNSMTCEMEIKASLDGATWTLIGKRVTGTTTSINTSDLNKDTKHVKCIVYKSGTSIVVCEQSVVVKDNTDENALLFVELNNQVLIQGSKLVAKSVVADALAANSVTAEKIAADSVDASKINVTTLSAITGNVGTLNAGLIHSNTYTYNSGAYSSSGIEIGLNGNGYIHAKNFGIDTNGNAYFNGAITATSLTLSGNATIPASKVTGLPSAPDLTLYIRKDGTIGTVGDGYTGFKVSSAGLLQASNAVIYGTIYASSGSFAGTVNATNLYAKQYYYIYYSSLSDRLPVITTGEWGSYSYYSLSIGIDPTSYYGTYMSFIGDKKSNGRSIIEFNADSVSFNGAEIIGHASQDAYSSHTHYRLDATAFNDHVALETTTSTSTNRAFRPGSDNLVRCGGTDYRWSTVYSKNGVDTSSDKNEKVYIRDIDERYENMFMDLHPVNYMWKKIYDEQDEPDRIHCGLIAQEVNEVAEKNGLSSSSVAAICHDDLENPLPDGRTERWGLRYGEFHGLEIHMIQKAIHRIEELENKITELESKLNSSDYSS